jgi:hypothetical protein
MSKTKLIINNNGSIKIEGDFEIMDSSGMVYGLEGRTALVLSGCLRVAILRWFTSKYF